MKTANPKNKAGFERYRERLTKPSFMHQIDSIFVMELGVALSYYHGGYIRAGWALLWYGVRAGLRGQYWKWVFRFCDKVGWTRLQVIPGTPWFERHSAKCDKMNCSAAECFLSRIPNWYKKLTGMEHE